jgi:hypothetical protein
MMPTIVTGSPLIVTERPIAAASPPNCRSHAACERIIVRGAS